MTATNLVYFPDLQIGATVTDINGLGFSCSVGQLAAIGYGMIVPLNGVQYLVVCKPAETGIVITDSGTVMHTAQPAPAEICSIVLFGKKPKPHFAS